MKNYLLPVVGLMMMTGAVAQDKSLVNTSKSQFAVTTPVNIADVNWTNGFWGEWMTTAKQTMVPSILDLYCNADIAHAYRNFEIAAGQEKGEHQGPPFHDGDFYKVLEAAIITAAQTKDAKLSARIDSIIATIAKCQSENGYIHTPTTIAHINNPGKSQAFEDRMNFETYNMGHLMTAACLHYRLTGKTTLLDVARKATDFLVDFHERATVEAARNAICPSHYMGVVEMYRTTGDKRYLELSKKMIDIRGLVENGTDDNQDRTPFRQQTKAMGHAVRANYLYAGVADVYAETGDSSLLKSLFPIWNDVMSHRMYVTGACGALYDGTSPDGTCYEPKEIQKTHQAYGREFQLPNLTAHNETCANIGNMLWNWRMFLITGEAKYMDIVELTLYNSILSGVDLHGTNFCYTNPLKVDDKIPFTLRWSKVREPYIALSNCCPPNVVRTVAETSAYAYTLSDNGVMINLYGSNNIKSTLKNGTAINLSQQSNYPWDGAIQVIVNTNAKKAYDIALRIPGWCNQATLLVNGVEKQTIVKSATYYVVNQAWKKGDKIELKLNMPAVLLEANPLVEETRNQVCVKRGPVVYCIEQADMPGQDIFDVRIPAAINLIPEMTTIDGHSIALLKGTAAISTPNEWQNALYRPVGSTTDKPFNITLVPYFAWGNREKGNMSVWMPVKW